MSYLKEALKGAIFAGCVFFGFMVIVFTIPKSEAAELVKDIGFESGTLSGMTCSGNCPKVSTLLPMIGKYSGDFDLTRSMSTNFRTEVQGIQAFDYGKEYWIGMDFQWKDWATDSNPEIAPFQVHNTDFTQGHDCNLGAAVATAPILMVSSNDKVSFLIYGKRKLFEVPIVKSKWHKLVIRFVGATSNGVVEAWYDGQKMGTFNGQTLTDKNGCGTVMPPPYWKMGVYKWSWKTATTQSSRRQLFIDNLKIAKGAEAYSLVSGSILPDPMPDPDPTPTPTPTPDPKPVPDYPNDDFNRANSGTVGNGWVETEATNASIAIADNKLFFADASDVANKPIVSKQFKPLGDGTYQFDVTMDWKRVLLEANYAVFVQLGTGFTSDTDTGAAVNLVWGNINGEHETLAFRANGQTTPLKTITGEHKLSVILKKTEYDVLVDGELVKSGIPMSGTIDTVRFFTSGLNELYFSGRTFDDVSINPVTLDTSPPFMANLCSSPTSVTVRWETDEPSDSTVNYGIVDTAENTATLPDMTTDHVMKLDVDQGEYKYQAISKDAAGNRSTMNGTFTVGVCQ